MFILSCSCRAFKDPCKHCVSTSLESPLRKQRITARKRTG
ncbi:MAG: SWIM zinc finger family protein [Armatimonadetes bacterium]|nr:SWIM zinc finger family protein [Armatimonadota bacterium]